MTLLRFTVLVLGLLVHKPTTAQEKPILLVTTDIGQDPDDLQSMIRLLHYANEFHLAGIIANADDNVSHEVPIVRDTILHQCIDAYDLIDENLRTHDATYPHASTLRGIIKKGHAGNDVRTPPEEYIGPRHNTEGSDHIIQVIAKAKRPVHIAVWGGGADLAQALWKVKTRCQPDQLALFIEKMRVFFIGKQDSTVDWIIKEFPDLWAIVAMDHEGDKWESTYRGLFYGGDMSTTTETWLKQNILAENPLAAMYPTKTYTGGEQRNPHGAMKEGDTPSWFFFLQNGLNVPEDPTAGGWGGRFRAVRHNLFFDDRDLAYDASADTMTVSARGTVFRWREDFQNDFAARVQWGSSKSKTTNHHPIIEIKNFPEDQWTWYRRCMPGNVVHLDATQSSDPDGDHLAYECLIYEEAGTFSQSEKIIINQESAGLFAISIPQTARGRDIHLILRIKDDGLPNLSVYRRVILEVR